MNPPLYLLYLDRYHQGDPLFQKELAQRFARSAPGEPPALLLHTSGEKLERTLEAEGRFPERREGVVVTETPREEALAERAAREANQDLVSLFTDEQVSVVGLQGSDRGLLSVAEDGGVEAGALGWVADLIKMRVVPVVSALAEGPAGDTQEVPPARVALALAGALGEDFDVTICFLAKGDLPEAETTAPSALPGGTLPEPEVAQRVVEARESGALVTDLNGVFAEGGPQGTRLHGT